MWQLCTTFAAAVLAYDVWFYVVHRLLHVPCVYKRFHYQHHASKHPAAKDAFTASMTENVISGVGIVAPLALQTQPSMAGFMAAYIFCFFRGVLRHDVRAAWLVGHHHLQHHIDPSCNYSSWYLDVALGTSWSQSHRRA